MNIGNMRSQPGDLLLVSAQQSSNVGLVLRAASSQLQFDQTRQTNVRQLTRSRAQFRRVRNRCWCQLICRSRPRTFGQNIDLDFRFSMDQLGPTSWFNRQQVEAGYCRNLSKLINPVRRQRDVDVLRHSPDVAMPPNGPTAAQN